MPVRWQTGVYQIRNLVNGKVYVGGAYVSFAVRKKMHWYALKAGRHFNRHLRNAWKKYGEGAFVFEVLERCCPEDVGAAEQKWLDSVNPTNPNVGYNLNPTAGSMLGFKHSDETKAAYSMARKGRKLSEEHVAKLRAAGERRRGVPMSVEARRKMSEAMVGNTNGHAQKLPEARARVAKEAADRWQDQEYKTRVGAAISAGLTGKKLSEEHRDALRRSHNTPEFKKKMSEVARKREAQKRLRRLTEEG